MNKITTNILTFLAITIIGIVFQINNLKAEKNFESSFDKFSKAIEDNSFLIEEAFNQEVKVVHNIQNAVYYKHPSTSFYYSFTQEWPIAGIEHQLSFTVPYTNAGKLGCLGDFMINYRYQLFYKEDWALVAPRISIIVPSPVINNYLGTGNEGFQLAIPATKRISELFMVHANIGLTYLYKSRFLDDMTGVEFKKSIFNYNFGIGVNMIATSNLNLVAELVQNIYTDAPSANQTGFINETIFSPGVRYAINLGETQIVPGLAVPIRYRSDNHLTYAGFFFYFSVEFPY